MPKKKVTRSSTRRKSGTVSRQPDHLSDLIDGSGKVLELIVEPDWRPSVHANLQVIFQQAALFMAFELPDDTEPAPIFRA